MKEAKGLRDGILKELKDGLYSNVIIDGDRVGSIIRLLSLTSAVGVSCLDSLGNLLTSLRKFEIREEEGFTKKEKLESLTKNIPLLEYLIDTQEKKIQENISKIRGEIFLAKKLIEELKTDLQHDQVEDIPKKKTHKRR